MDRLGWAGGRGGARACRRGWRLGTEAMGRVCSRIPFGPCVPRVTRMSMRGADEVEACVGGAGVEPGQCEERQDQQAEKKAFAHRLLLDDSAGARMVNEGGDASFCLGRPGVRSQAEGWFRVADGNATARS